MARTKGSGGAGGNIGGWIGLGVTVLTALATLLQTGKSFKGDRKLKKKFNDLDKMLRKGQLSQEEYDKLRERLVNESQTQEI